MRVTTINENNATSVEVGNAIGSFSIDPKSIEIITFELNAEMQNDIYFEYSNPQVEYPIKLSLLKQAPAKARFAIIPGEVSNLFFDQYRFPVDDVGSDTSSKSAVFILKADILKFLRLTFSQETTYTIHIVSSY